MLLLRVFKTAENAERRRVPQRKEKRNNETLGTVFLFLSPLCGLCEPLYGLKAPRSLRLNLIK